MTAPAVTVNLSATLSSNAGVVAIGNVLVPGTGGYVIATTANRAAGGRAHGIALTAWSSNVTPGAVQLQHVGVVDAAVTGLGAGALSWVRVSATGTLERVTPAGSDDVVGWCHMDGTLFALFGMLTAAIVNGGGGASTPTGTGLPHIVGGVQNAAASLLVNADVNAAAAIAGTKVAPDFGAQDVTTAGNGLWGATPRASAGLWRFPNGATAKARRAANDGDVQVFEVDTNNDAWFGCNAANSADSRFAMVRGNSGTLLGFGGADQVSIGTAGGAGFNSLATKLPVIGFAQPYAGLNGLFSKTLTAAQSYDLASTEYCYSTLKFVSNGANVVRLPPATDDQAYFKFVWNVSGGGTISVRDTNAVTAAATLASGNGALFLWANGAVKQIGAAFAVA